MTSAPYELRNIGHRTRGKRCRIESSHISVGIQQQYLTVVDKAVADFTANQKFETPGFIGIVGERESTRGHPSGGKHQQAVIERLYAEHLAAPQSEPLQVLEIVGNARHIIKHGIAPRHHKHVVAAVKAQISHLLKLSEAEHLVIETREFVKSIVG